MKGGGLPIPGGESNIEVVPQRRADGNFSLRLILSRVVDVFFGPEPTQEVSLNRNIDASGKNIFFRVPALRHPLVDHRVSAQGKALSLSNREELIQVWTIPCCDNSMKPYWIILGRLMH